MNQPPIAPTVFPATPAATIARYAKNGVLISCPNSATWPASAPEASAPPYSIVSSLAAGRTAASAIRMKTATSPWSPMKDVTASRLSQRRVGRVRHLCALAVAVPAVWAAAAGAHPVARTPVPILEYHVIGDPPQGSAVAGLYTSVADFRRQLAWLAAHGYRPVTLDRVYRNWFEGGSLPAKPVALTFDDGYPQDVSVVLPLLRARHWSANLNLQVGNLVPKRVRELIAAGWEVDAHTFTHPDLTKVTESQLRREIAGSRRWIQNVFKLPVDFFCYPFGRYDDAVVAEVRRAGFLGAETETAGFASPRDGMATLDRIEIVRGDGVAGLARKLAG